jgi:tetratricopeptide (TPR) repeat protein
MDPIVYFSIVIGSIAAIASIYEIMRLAKKKSAPVGPLEIMTLAEKKTAPAGPLEILPRAAHFVGREKELEKLLGDLKPGAVVEVCGPGGMGKTALAAEAICKLTENGSEPPKDFPDGVLVHSFYKQADVILAFEHIVRSYGGEPKPTPAIAAQELLAGKQALLVLDGAEQAQNLNLLLEMRGRCGILITSRRREGEAIRQDLPPLELAEAVELLQDRGGEWAADEAQGRRICELVGRLPMAIVLAGSYLCESDVTAREYADWLETSPLAALDQGKRRMESVTVLLERNLEEVSEAARQALGAIGLLALAPFEREWVREALGVSEEAALAAFGELARYSLVRRSDEGWYQASHMLVHTYARERLAAKASKGVLEALCDGFERLVAEERVKGEDGYEKLNRIRPHALAVLERMAVEGKWGEGKGLAYSLEDYLDLGGFWSERVRLAERGTRGAREISDRTEEANWLNILGLVYAGLGQVEQAIGYYEYALAIDQEIGDHRGEGDRLGNLGNVYADLGQVEQAIVYYGQALAIAQEIGDRRGEGNQLGNLGLAYADLGQVEKAMGYLEQALAIAKEIGDRRGEGNQLGNLGIAYKDLGQVEKAIGYYEQALAIAQEIGDRRGEGNWLYNLGIAFKNLGRSDQAIGYFEESLAIRREIGDRRGEVANLGKLGVVYNNLLQMEKAVGYYGQALAIAQEIGDRRGEGDQLGNLGIAYENLGQAKKALGYYEQALAIQREIGDRRGEGNQLANLGKAYEKVNEIRKACDLWRQALKIYEEIKDPQAEWVRGWLEENCEL